MLDLNKSKLKIGDVIYNTILIILIVLLVLSLINRTREDRSIFGYTPTIVMSGSMLPTLKVYSMNIMKECDIEDINVGDIIVYRNNEKGINVIHRVIEITSMDGNIALKTKGDNNTGEDKILTTSDNLIGKIVLTMNWASWIISKTINPSGTSFDAFKIAVIIFIASTIIGICLNIIKYCIKLAYNKLVNKIKNIK